MYTNKKGKKILFDSGSEEEDDDIGTNYNLKLSLKLSVHIFFSDYNGLFWVKSRGKHVLENAYLQWSTTYKKCLTCKNTVEYIMSEWILLLSRAFLLHLLSRLHSTMTFQYIIQWLGNSVLRDHSYKFYMYVTSARRKSEAFLFSKNANHSILNESLIFINSRRSSNAWSKYDKKQSWYQACQSRIS